MERIAVPISSALLCVVSFMTAKYPSSLSMLTPAILALLAVLDIAMAKSADDTAACKSIAVSLSTIPDTSSTASP